MFEHTFPRGVERMGQAKKKRVEKWRQRSFLYPAQVFMGANRKKRTRDGGSVSSGNPQHKNGSLSRSALKRAYCTCPLGRRGTKTAHVRIGFTVPSSLYYECGKSGERIIEKTCEKVERCIYPSTYLNNRRKEALPDDGLKREDLLVKFQVNLTKSSHST